MLPNLATPEFITKLPSNDKQITFRPFLVKEEKALLLALESGDGKEVENSIFNIIVNCVNMDEEDIRNLPSFDIEHLFLQIRARSVDNIIKLRLKHQNSKECDHVTDYNLNIDDIKVHTSKNHNKRIMLTDNVGVQLEYPSLNRAQALSDSMVDSNVENMFSFIAGSIEYVFDEDNVYEDATLEEKIKFVEGVNKEQFGKLLEFYQTTPAMQHDIEFTCSKCGVSEKITLKGLESFFL